MRLIDPQDVLAAVAQGTHVILTEHSNSERGYLKVRNSPRFRLFVSASFFILKHTITTTASHGTLDPTVAQVLKQKLEESFKGRLAVLISTSDADPLRVM